VLSLIVNWRVFDRKVWLFVGFVLYLAIQIATMTYFVPEQETLIASANALSQDVLSSRANRWIVMNYFRSGAGVLAFACLLAAVLEPVPPQPR
jgi:uncharacterized membrane protein